ncbi:MAG: putative permease [Candidatus Methanofastidiosum methylothiophilum]|uniref:Putative permease n=1 Tax=Candidatus Methanofastidiosum methylothiophilum TaxID=1705564 RepID=A0A150J6Y3_9EURY|nr:MAG: putative permease [Candidatus Methanofastidiosum methylthiophilus]NMC76632.1 permease [Candidatus Methanofastidiosa archaeon]
MKKYLKEYGFILLFLVFGTVSYFYNYNFGMNVSNVFLNMFIEMISFIPIVFILVGLLDAWIPSQKFQKYMGPDSGVKGTILSVVFSMFQAGPLYGAFPIVYILYKKGASVKNIFIFLGCFSALKIPMLSIEIGYLGIEFTLARTLVAIPLFIIIGYIMEYYLKNKDFKITDPTEVKS